ncbi:MAG: hypothetical protein JSR61_02075 [Proteobacteria bacterium]|nr:hypothetical protein [Pseudomonadota bacterium]
MAAQRRPLSIRQIFAMPATIGLVSGAGLILALVGDGWWDVAGWIGLGLAPAIAIFCLTFGGRTG